MKSPRESDSLNVVVSELTVTKGQRGHPRIGRFCLACFKTTSWEYDRVRGHSVCRACGGFKATSPETAHYIIKETKRRVREFLGIFYPMASKVGVVLVVIYAIIMSLSSIAIMGRVRK